MVKENYRNKLDGNDLDLSLMSLAEIPVREIAALPKATQIDLSCNHLTTIPTSFCNLKQIVKLDLSRNAIESLPDNFGDLAKLQYLDLYNNKLSMLPLSFCQLQNLKWLDLKGNPLSPQLKAIAGDCLDSKQCQNCAKKVVQFMQSVQSEVLLEQERRRKRDEDLAAQRKLQDELENEVQRKAKKAAKERKRAALQAQKLERQKQQQDSSASDSGISCTKNEQRGPSVKQEKASNKSNSGGMGCLGVLMKIVAFLFVIVSVGFGLLFLYTRGDFTESGIRLALQAISKDALSLLSHLKYFGLKCFSWFQNEGWLVLKLVAGWAGSMFQDAIEILTQIWIHLMDKLAILTSELKAA